VGTAGTAKIPEGRDRGDLLEATISLDRSLFRGDRSRILRDLYKISPRLFVATEEAGGISAYAFGKPVGKNFEIGPVCRNSTQLEPALGVLDAMLTRMETRIHLAVPDINNDIIAVLKARGFKFIEYVYQMVKGSSSPTDLKRTCTVGALEKG
jgi:hypothetical protein